MRGLFIQQKYRSYIEWQLRRSRLTTEYQAKDLTVGQHVSNFSKLLSGRHIPQKEQYRSSAPDLHLRMRKLIPAPATLAFTLRDAPQDRVLTRRIGTGPRYGSIRELKGPQIRLRQAS